MIPSYLQLLIKKITHSRSNEMIERIIDAIGEDASLAVEVRRQLMLTDEDIADRLLPSLPVHTLVVAVNFPPFNDASAVTAMKRIIDAGELVDVVVQNLSSIRTVDDSLWESVRPFVRHLFVVNVPPTFSSWGLISAYVSAGVRALESAWPDGLPYKNVRSRVMFPAAHFLAALLTARGGLHWTAEFSDPVRQGIDGSLRRTGPVPNDGLSNELLRHCPPGIRRALTIDRKITFWCEYLVYGLATTVVYTNKNQQEVMLGSLKNVPAALIDTIRGKSVINHHPTLSPEWYACRPHPVRSHAEQFILKLGYFGVFYTNRGVGEIVSAMASLPADEQNQVELTIFTDKPDKVRSVLKEYRLGNRLRVCKYLNYLDFLATLKIFDVLLVPDVQSAGYEKNPYLPSKFSDYRGSGADIWGVVDGTSTLSRFSSDVLPFRTPLRDVHASCNMLRS